MRQTFLMIVALRIRCAVGSLFLPSVCVTSVLSGDDSTGDSSLLRDDVRREFQFPFGFLCRFTGCSGGGRGWDGLAFALSNDKGKKQVFV